MLDNNCFTNNCNGNEQLEDKQMQHPSPARTNLRQHVCWFLGAEEEHSDVLRRFVREAMERGEQVLYFADAGTAKAVWKCVREAGLPIETWLASGRISVISPEQAFLKDRPLDPDRAAAFLRDLVASSLAKGHTGLRLILEMAWLTAGEEAAAQLEALEAEIDALSKKSPLMALCRYDSRKFSSACLSRMLSFHPIVLLANEFCKNPYYSPRDLPSTPERDAAALSYQLKAIREGQESDAASRLPALAFENVADALVVTDAQCRILAWNTSAEKLFGYTPSEVLGKTPGMLYRPSETADLSRKIRKAAQENGFWHGDILFVRKDGTSGVGETLVTAVRDEREGQVLIIRASRDITERKAAAEAARRSAAILRAVAFAVEQFLGTGPGRAGIEAVLARLGEAAGVSRVYVFENHLSADGAPLTSQRHEWVAEGIEPQIDNPALQNFPWREGGFARWVEILKADGVVAGPIRTFPQSERAILEPQDIRALAAMPIFAEQELWGFIGFDDCASEREWSPPEIDALRVAARVIGQVVRYERTREALLESEKELRKSHDELELRVHQRTKELEAANVLLREEMKRREEVESALGESVGRWHATFDAMRDAIFLTDLDLKILLCNQTAAQLLQKPIREILGQKSCELLRALAMPDAKCPFRRMLRSGNRESEHVSLGEKWFSVTVDPRQGADGKINGSVHVISDVTERKQAEDEIRRQNEELARFNRLAVGRELRMIELKQQVNELARQAGQPPPYPMTFLAKDQQTAAGGDRGADCSHPPVPEQPQAEGKSTP